MDEQQKQQVIVRQSQLKNSLDYFKTLGVKPTITELIRVARVFSIFCLDGYNKKTISLINEGDEYLKKKFEENE